MCTHKPTFSSPQTPWKRVSHERGSGGGGAWLLGGGSVNPVCSALEGVCGFRSPVGRAPNAAARGSAPQKAPGDAWLRGAQLALNIWWDSSARSRVALARGFCSPTPSHLSSRSHYFHVDNLSSFFEAPLCGCIGVSYNFIMAFLLFYIPASGANFFISLSSFKKKSLSPCPPPPRAKHISSIGHSKDQWRGKAQERLKGGGEREGGVAVWKIQGRKGETGPFTERVIQ